MWETSVAIRGMSRSGIVTMVDNTRIESANDISGALSLFNVHDFERIETIRSSGAAVYGTGALGGIVHFITKRAAFSEQDRMLGEFSSDVSTVNNCTSQFIALEASSERAAGRFSGSFRRADNTSTPSGILPNSQFRDFSATGSLGLKTFGDESLQLSYQVSQAENTGISGGSPISAAATATYKRFRRELVGLEYTIPALSAQFLSLTIRFSRQVISRSVEIIQTPSLTLTPHAVHTTLSSQIETKIDVGENALLVAGAEVWQRDLVSRRERINKTDNSITGDIPVPHSQFLSAGIYSQYEWTIIPGRVTLITGIRYDHINITNDAAVNPEYVIKNGIFNSTPQNQTILWNSGSTSNRSWNINGGVQYSLSDRIDLSVLASTSFRSPSLEERYQYLTLGDGIHAGNPDLDPEQSQSLNAGMQWHTEDMFVRTDVFINSLNGLVADVPGTFEGNPAFVKQNISTARLYGFEISGGYNVIPGTGISFTVSSVRGENTALRTNLPFIPPLHGSLGIRKTTDGIGTLNLSSSFSADQSLTAAGEKRTAGYVVFDIDGVSVPIRTEGFSMTVTGGIRNIFNRAYHNHLSTIRGTNREAPGRDFFLSVTVKK